MCAAENDEIEALHKAEAYSGGGRREGEREEHAAATALQGVIRPRACQQPWVGLGAAGLVDG